MTIFLSNYWSLYNTKLDFPTSCENCNFPLNSIYFLVNAPLKKLDQIFLPGREQGKKVGFFLETISKQFINPEVIYEVLCALAKPLTYTSFLF